jgi:large subunit ribosomal protein L15
MKLHDLRPAAGAKRPRVRVGRGIAAGKGKTAGRGTKGQKARAGASSPPWFEGGQTPLHIRIPKLRGFRNINDIEYEVVNVGAIGAAVTAGKLPTVKGSPTTVNADLLKDAGLVRTIRKPLKVLGGGELATALFVVADAFTRSARQKIEAAGGTAQVLELPSGPLGALGIQAETPIETGATTEPAAEATSPRPSTRRARKPATPEAPSVDTPGPDAVEPTPADASTEATDASPDAG